MSKVKNKNNPLIKSKELYEDLVKTLHTQILDKPLLCFSFQVTEEELLEAFQFYNPKFSSYTLDDFLAVYARLGLVALQKSMFANALKNTAQASHLKFMAEQFLGLVEPTNSLPPQEGYTVDVADNNRLKYQQ